MTVPMGVEPQYELWLVKGSDLVPREKENALDPYPVVFDRPESNLQDIKRGRKNHVRLKALNPGLSIGLPLSSFFAFKKNYLISHILGLL